VSVTRAKPPKFSSSSVEHNITMLSLSDKFLCDLLRQPFGPYLEETVLSDKCKFVPTKRLLLNDFQLAYNDEPTGYVSPHCLLNQAEFKQSSHTQTQL
jgi:hypothetical protein